MFNKKKKSALKVQLGMDLKRCADCVKYERPCLVDGQPAIFHRWVDEEKALLRINLFCKPQEQEAIVRRFREEGIFDGGCSVEKLRETSALVEYPGGTVSRVRPELVRFLDRGED